LNNKDNRPWLAFSKKSVNHFYCKICFEDNKGGISAVKMHMCTMKHQRAAKSVSGTSSISEMNQQMLSRTITIEKKNEGELGIAMFVQNITFRSTLPII